MLGTSLTNAKKRLHRDTSTGQTFAMKRLKPSASNQALTNQKKAPAKSQFELKLSKMKTEQLTALMKSQSTDRLEIDQKQKASSQKMQQADKCILEAVKIECESILDMQSQIEKLEFKLDENERQNQADVRAYEQVKTEADQKILTVNNID